MSRTLNTFIFTYCILNTLAQDSPWEQHTEMMIRIISVIQYSVVPAIWERSRGYNFSCSTSVISVLGREEAHQRKIKLLLKGIKTKGQSFN